MSKSGAKNLARRVRNLFQFNKTWHPQTSNDAEQELKNQNTQNLMILGSVEFDGINRDLIGRGSVYRCAVCDTVLRSKALLRSHVRHYHTNVKFSECPHCDVVYWNRTDLRHHILVCYGSF